MNTYFRLKKEALPYFKADLATEIKTWDFWSELNVDDNALERIEPPFLSFGCKKQSFRDDGSKLEHTDLCGWSDKDGSKFHFTINFPSHDYKKYEYFHYPKVIRDLMDKIQNEINQFNLQIEKGE